MKTLIEEINDKLKDIINGLEVQKGELEESLVLVQEKIDRKIDEAKVYKNDVEKSKDIIKSLENEITSLENDLNDLTVRFSNKDLNAIVETGNKEINAQIVARQKEISKERDKIAEYTEQAKMIKDLLINLKKDKESKKDKLDNVEKALNYYNIELNKIIEYSLENYDNLVVLNSETVDGTSYDEPYEFNNDDIVDDKPIFDAIESIEKENDGESEVVSAESENVDEVSHDDNQVRDYSDNIFNLNLDDNNDIDSKIDFKALNDSIDQEYENIFGSSLNEVNEVQENTNYENTQKVDDTETVNNFDFNFENAFALSENDLNSEPDVVLEQTNNESSDDLAKNFFMTNGIDYDKFSEENKTKLANNFDLVKYTTILDTLRKNNLKFDYLDDNVDIFEMNANELETIIAKLLLAGQSTLNISYVLSTLPLINSKDLQEVIDSYGSTINDANITDLISKAKQLNDIKGGTN